MHIRTIIKSIARYIPNVDTNPGMKTVIQELSNVRTAQEMIEKTVLNREDLFELFDNIDIKNDN